MAKNKKKRPSKKSVERSTRQYRRNKAQREVAKQLSKPEEQTESAEPTAIREAGDINAKINDPRPLGYGNALVPQGERIPPKLDPRDAAADVEEVETVKKLEAEPPKVDKALTALVQERRRQQKSDENSRVVPLEEAVARVEEKTGRGDLADPTPGQERFEESLRGGNIGTGNINYRFLPSAPPQDKPATPSLITKFQARTQRGSDMQNPPLSVAPGEPATNQINDTARRLAVASLKENNVVPPNEEPSEDLVTSELVNNTTHEQKARIMAYTGLTHEDLLEYMGRHEREGRNRLSNLHANVMQFQRSRQKHDVTRDMGLIRNDDGSFTATPEAQTQWWQHPTETVKINGLDVRKTYRVSDMHPDMIKELNHPSGWGGHSGNADFEGVTGSAASGTVSPVIKRFGHSQSGPRDSQTWKFEAPPAGWGEDESISGIRSDHITMLGSGVTPNVLNIVERVGQGYKGSTDLGTAEKPKRSSGDLSTTKQDEEDIESEGNRSRNRRIFETRVQSRPTVNNIQVTIGTPGSLRGTERAQSDPDFPAVVTATPGRKSFETETTYVQKKFKKPRKKKSQDSIVGIGGEGIPGTFNAANHPVPLPPRAGRRGGTTVIVDPETGRRSQRRAVLVTQTGLQSSLRTPAEEAAETLVGQNEVAEEILKGNRSQQFMQLLRPAAPTGTVFMGPPKKLPKQDVIDFGKADFSLGDTKRKVPPVVRQIVEGPIERTQYNLEQSATGGTGYYEEYAPGSNKKQLVARPVEQTKNATIKSTIRDAGYGRVSYAPEQPEREKEDTSKPLTSAIGAAEFKTITARQREEDAAAAAAEAAKTKAAEERAPLPGQYMFDFQDPAKPGMMISRQFLGGNIRPLTDEEASVEQSGWNTIRGMNPRGIVDRPTQATPLSTGSIELSNQPPGVEVPPVLPTGLPHGVKDSSFGYQTVTYEDEKGNKKSYKANKRGIRRAEEQKLRDKLAKDRSKPKAGERLVTVGDVETGQEGAALVTTDEKTGDQVTRKLRGGSTIRNERAASKKKKKS